MKKQFLFILSLIGLLVGGKSFSQTIQPIQFANGTLQTSDNIARQTFKTAEISKAFFEGNYYVAVQFIKLPAANIKQQLLTDGIQLKEYLPGNAYMAVISSSFDFKKAIRYNINSINIIPAAYKIDSKLDTYQNNESKEQQHLLAITYFDGLNKKKVQTILQQLGALVASTRFDDGNTIFIQVDKAIANTIAGLPFISNIALQSMTDQSLNYKSIAAHGISGLNAVNGKNLNGRGVTVGVGDNSDIDTHIDFTGRLINRNPTIAASHGTHTAGTTAGGGIINEKNHGMAAKATIINQYFSDIIVNTPAYISDYNMVASNNSYHSANAGCAGQGRYDFMSNYIDKQMARNKEVLQIFAAGNDGNLSCSPYSAGFGTVKTGWQSSKNVLTVGAISAADNIIGGFSSRGPVKDGRIKPEICANGVSVISTIPFNSYGLSTGTSMACPAVTGAATLLYERYRQLNGGANPKASLIKTLLCNTAEDLGNTGPDYTYGFGMLNATRAVAAIESQQYFVSMVNNANINVQNISIPANIKRLKIMLYWADSAAAVNAGNALVNDLDLTVVSPSTVLFRPLTLNAASNSVNNTAIQALDHINNIEQVVIENPGAGIYSINVNGYNIPFGPQEYIISYEMLKADITVAYPFGGEKLVPGETENIRWTAYDDNPNTFTIEYATDNGNNWTVINNAVAAGSRIFSWTVPAAVTNTALIKISRNGTALTAQSASNFSVIGQPVVTATNVCEGAVQLNWPAITGATSYDIVQFVKDSMQVVANTISNSFIITGLDKNTTYWMGAVAKNGTNTGRRSVSLNVLPNSGTCSLASFTDDVKVDTIVEPTTARQQFANATNATKPVKIKIKNLGTQPVSGPFNVTYSYNGNIVTEILNTTIAANTVFTYTFTGMYSIPIAGYQYNFKAWITKSSDANHLNDTAYKKVQYINNDAIVTTPVLEGFETMPAIEITDNAMAIGGNDHLDFTTNTTRGRARTFVNSGFAFSGTKALTLDQSPYNDITTTDSAIFNYNLSLLNNDQLRFDFYYKNHGQVNYAGNKVWIRGSENNSWVEAYNLYDNQATLGGWKKAIININEILENAVPAQQPTATFQIKLGQQGNASTNNPNPVNDIDDGYTFDNLVLDKAINDVAVTAINSPNQGGCALTASNPVSIQIKNYNNAIFNNLLVSYQINNGSIVTEIINSIEANQSLNYTFTQMADFAAYINYDVKVWVKYVGDSYTANDSILDFSVRNSPIISSYPYLQTFESDAGFFYTNGNNSSWQWGIPASTIINKAPNGSKAWVTNLTGNYNDNETSYLTSPCFDISSLQKPVLSFSHIYDIELDYDFTWVEYSIDGKNWQKLGTTGNGTNWYENIGFNNWRISNKNWHVASYDLPTTASNIRFRFVLYSDGGVTQEGIGIDDVRVHEKSEIATNISNLLPITVNAGWSNNWVPFADGNQTPGKVYVLGEINSNGQDLGSVTIKPYLNSQASIRSINGQYYLDRSFVIQSTKAPTSNIDIRLYFTHTDALTLINAAGCNGCIKPKDAYDMGVTKYKGNEAEENELLTDNLNGYYQFITPANTAIYPHGNGYYASFTTNNFGECWFGKGQLAPTFISNCAGGTINYTVLANAATYQWQLNNGSGYISISDNINYSGSLTNNLQITGVPGSFTGYKYRCVVNGVNGLENTLRFNNLWNGSVNTDWFNTGNWSCSSIPDQYTDAIIPSALARYPVINTNTAIRYIRVLSGATVIVNAGINVDVKGK